MAASIHRREIWRWIRVGIPIALVWGFIALSFSLPFERLFDHWVLSAVQQIDVRDPYTVIIDRAEQDGAESAADRRIELASLIRTIDHSKPSSIIILDQLNTPTSATADADLADALNDTTVPVYLVVGGSFNHSIPIADEALPMPIFREAAVLTHNLQMIALSIEQGVIAKDTVTKDGEIVRHVALEIFGHPSPDEFYPLDDRIRGSITDRIASATLLSGDENSVFLSGDAVIIEAAVRPTEPPMVRILNSDQEANEVAAAIYAVRSGVPIHIQSFIFLVSVMVLMAAIWIIRGRLFGYRTAFALSACWLILAFVLIAFKVYVPVIDTIALLMVLAATNNTLTIEGRVAERTKRQHFRTGLPNELAFKEAAFDEHQVLFASSYIGQDYSAENFDRLWHMSKQAGIKGSAFHLTGATLAIRARRDAIPTLQDMAATLHARERRISSVFCLNPHAIEPDHREAELQKAVQYATDRNLAYAVIGAPKESHSSPVSRTNVSPIKLPASVFNLRTGHRAGFRVDLLSVEGNAEKDATEARTKLRRAMAANSRSKEGADLWLTANIAMLGPIFVAEISEIAKQVGSNEGIVTLELVDVFAASITGLQRTALRQFAKAGVLVAGGNLDGRQVTCEDVLAAPVQALSIDAFNYMDATSSIDIFFSAVRFAEGTSRDLLVWNIPSAAIATAARDAGVVIASGPGVKEMMNDLAH